MAKIQQEFQQNLGAAGSGTAPLIRRYFTETLTTSAENSTDMLFIDCEQKPALYHTKATLFGWTQSGAATTGDITITQSGTAIDGSTGVASAMQTDLVPGSIIRVASTTATIDTITSQEAADLTESWTPATTTNSSYTSIWRTVATWEGVHHTTEHDVKPYGAVDPVPTNHLNEAGTLDVRVSTSGGVPQLVFTVETTAADTSHGAGNANTTIWVILVEQVINVMSFS